ncbi:MAG: hypothetical protein DRP82_06465 [Planctomycetota bacterium]|nr:MAG: hypothetical protein DRP82_06465 [Planctomycetota bacterium]
MGMRIAMEYERQNGRRPEDVSEQKLGFDIRSLDPAAKKTRYIEVKARSRVGPVSLTINEWFKAQRFGDDYYLYVIYNAREAPSLHIIRNPAQNLTPTQKVEVRFAFLPDQILNKSANSSGGLGKCT